ncbi:MAG TPA: hypothetical protein VF491_19025 [Vicinamibacterales bacterium]|jgi:hypothetical protein
MQLEAAIRALYWSLTITGALSALAIPTIAKLTYTNTQHYSPYFGSVVSWSILAAVIGGVLLIAGRSGGPSNATIPDATPPGLTAFVLSVAIGIQLLVVPACLFAWRLEVEDLTGWTYPVLNKRWLGALYGIALGALVLLPPVLRRLHVANLEAPEPGIGQPVPAARSWRVAGAVALLALAWLRAGPPWNVAAHHRPIDFHEQVHLGPLQAVDKGYVPFVGPASTQYGPGTQLLTYAYMKWSDQFDIVGYREANLVLHFAATAIVGLLAWWTLGFPSALAVLILAWSFSPLGFFTPANDGTYQGFYGWGNAMRYLGALIVVPLMIRRMMASQAGRLDWHLPVIGVAAGLFAWLAQENLSATVTALAFVLVLMIATRTITWRTAASCTAQVAMGSAVVAIPIVVYYLLQGELSRFLRNYLLVPQAVAAGFSNTWWLEGPADGRYRAYCYTTAVIVAIGTATVWNLREMRLRHSLTRLQAQLLAYLGVLAASYHTALYRADSSHLVNTMLALPFVLVLVFRDLPEWSVKTPLLRLALRVAIVAVAICVYPISLVSTDLYAWVIKPSAVRFQQTVAARTPSSDPRPAFTRATALLQNEPVVVGPAGSMHQFLEDVSALRAIVGDRRTYVLHAHNIFTGLIYFMGDLTPAPYLFDRETMMINSGLAAESIEYMRARLDEFDCVVSSTLEAPEVKLFLSAHPNARIETLRLAGAPIYALLKP